MPVNWDVDRMIQEVEDAAMVGVIDGTNDVLSTAIESILQGDKTGLLYRRRGITHQASAPGEAPASDTGRLVQSGKAEFDRSQLAGTVRFSTEYAAALEFGRLDGSILPRPYARPALESNRAKIEQRIQDRVEQAIKRFD